MSSLTLDITADPDEFEEAVAEFLSRRVISRAEADTIEEYARRRAWWISGVAQMDVVQDVHDSIAEALRKGTSFEEWKKTAGPKLEQAWGRKDSARIQLIFRNASMQAYNAGRWEQMRAPHVLAVRPFGMLDVVDDSRTSDICRKFLSPPIVLPLDDPRWFRLSPPFHHGCRTGIRTLRRSVAEQKGITQGTPDLEIAEGWGYPPTITEPPKPSERAHQPDPDVQLEMALKAGKDARKRKPKVITQKPEHTPEHWEKLYRAEGYGDASPAMAWGRMVHERAKDMDPGEAAQLYEALLRKQVPGVSCLDLSEIQLATSKSKKLRNSANARAVERVKLLAQQHKLSNGFVPGTSYAHAGVEHLRDAAHRWASSFCSPALQGPEIGWWNLPVRLGDRAYFQPDRDDPRVVIPANDSASSAVHEFLHALERKNNLGPKVRAFRRVREQGDTLRKLSELTGDRRYKDDELARKDKYFKEYMGKEYPDSDPNFNEVLQVIGQYMVRGSASSILDNDPESLHFTLGVLAGK